MNVNDYLRMKKRLTLAARVEEFSSSDEDAVPTEEELKTQAAGMSRDEIVANLALIRELLDDPEEDVTDEERAALTKAHNAVANKLNSESAVKASVTHVCELSADADEFGHMCWGHPCGHNLGRRGKSLTPKGVKNSYQKRGSSQASEYLFGKYSFEYRPKNTNEAKRKIRKATTSRARWAAAALVFALPALIPGVHNPALKKLKLRSVQHRTAKRQMSALKSRKGE